MKISQSDLKISLIHYFTKINNYKVLKDKEDAFNTYLVSYDEEKLFSIINICTSTVEVSSVEINTIKSTVIENKDFVDSNINILYICLDPEGKEKIQDNVVYIKNYDDIRKKLGKTFPDLNNFEFYQEGDSIFNTSTKEDGEKKVQTEEDIEKDILKLNKQLKTINLPTIAIATFFCIIPTFLLILSYYFKTDASNTVFMKTIAVNNVVFCATNRTLFIDAKQYWRILTYGLSVFNFGSSTDTGNIIFSAIELIIVWVFAPVLIKTALFTQSKTNFWITFISSYLICGLFFSLCFVNLIFSGATVILALMIGQVFIGSVVRHEGKISTVIKFKLFIPLVILMIGAVISGTSDIILVATALAISASINYLLYYDYKNINAQIIMPVVVLIFFAYVMIMSFFLFHPVAVKNNDIVYGLAAYINKNIMSKDSINEIYKNIGWNIQLQITTSKDMNLANDGINYFYFITGF